MALLILLIGAALSPAVGFDFVWDDQRVFVESPTLGDPAAIPGYFTEGVASGLREGAANTERLDLYRPVFMTAVSLQGMVFDREPEGFHAVSIALHAGVCLLLWIAARRWTEGEWTAEACVGAFALHPVLAEVYFWPSAQPELLMALGGLGAVLLLDRRPVLAAACFLFGVLAKETLLLALPAITLYVWLHREDSSLRRPAVGLWAAGAIGVVMRALALGGSGAEGGRLADVVRLAPIAIADGARGIFGARPVGLRHLSFEYGGLGWGVAVAAGLGIVALGVGAWWVRERSPLLLVAWLITVCMVGPVALVAAVPGWGGYGRYLYLPAVFVVLGVAQLLPDRRGAALAIVVLMWHGMGMARAMEAWSSDEGLGQSQVHIAPELGVGHAWLGQLDLEAGDFAAAAEHYGTAVAVDPDYHPAFHNLAACLTRLGRGAGALAVLDDLEARHGVGPRSSFARGLALAQLGRTDDAAAVVEAALRGAPAHDDLLWLQSKLSEAGRDAPRGSEPGTGAPAPRTSGSP
ncbi:MAG: tetratricopeptide repeat protein [Proteobacteria bacterium]|nr:tetratricopeptide repeat protein [Pseudomonadota bacterium]